MLAAQKRIFIVGWDFDTRIALDPDEHGQGETLGRFMLNLARDKPGREIDILKWNFGALKQFFQPAGGGVAGALVADQGDRFPLRQLASAGMQPPPEDRRDRRQSRGLRRDRHFDSSRWDTPEHTGRRSAPHRPRRQALHAVARCDDDDARRGRGRACRAGPRTLVDRDQGQAQADRQVRGRLARGPAGDVPRRRYRHRPHPRRLRRSARSARDRDALHRHDLRRRNASSISRINISRRARSPPRSPSGWPRQTRPRSSWSCRASADGWLEQKAMDGARLKLVAGDRRQGQSQPLPHLRAGDEEARRHLCPCQGVDRR